MFNASVSSRYCHDIVAMARPYVNDLGPAQDNLGCALRLRTLINKKSCQQSIIEGDSLFKMLNY